MADPARGRYKEAYVALHARLDDKTVARVPYIWVDNDLSFAHGRIQGFPKKFGVISITQGGRSRAGRAHTRKGGHLRRPRGQPRCPPGTRGCHVGHPRRPGFVPKALRLPVWHTRLMPDLAGGEPLVLDLSRNIVSDFAVADVWTGNASLEFFESEFEELAALHPVDVVGGFRCSVAFSVTGAEIRPA